MIKKLACAAALAATVLVAPASAGRLELGVLDCTIDGGTGYIVTSNKGVACTFRPHHGGPPEAYTGVISKLGVDVGRTHQGELIWAVLAATRDRDSGDLAGSYYGVNAEASVVTGGGANLLVGGFNRAFSLQPLNVQAQTGVNLAVAVTSLQLIHSFK
ncbi:MAG: DUF992 domain-containing protein [Mesorhizobium sp.]|uniref:DUF992 domain-containing protein n=1 Tax=Mesorhizobium sp. TaxID=1871066 RepID=UPI000FE6BA19|nr:DUF992 domain-containing protein [Mesorhizobium sp.]RWM86754.1 MAG: DUF992 domain-containing protein [Mesorhizobium sp.]